jgi:site-specific DNA-methyltransferase (adenine-specific)
MSQAAFTLQGHNPDVLTCIANLSNDEVFTPPEFANQMLDTLAQSWAINNSGESIWSNKDVTFLDPCTKSGVFLREIVKRLNDGLTGEIPDLTERINHILTKQVFGISTTELTSLLARRSVYCSKYANGIHSIARTFTNDKGNIWFERTEHSWINTKCKFCGANERDYSRGSALETHAYAFIHTDDLDAHMRELFGGNMRFDVVIGNPPYQLGQSGGDAVGGFAMPIYQKFVQAAKSLDPTFILMVTPSRWFAGGRGLEEFRQSMLDDKRMRALIDFPNAGDVFPGVDIKGGVSYFLWDSKWSQPCEVTTYTNGEPGETVSRYLNEWDVLVRRNEAVSILKKVLNTCAKEHIGNLATKVSPIQPFSLRTNFRGATTIKGIKNPVTLYQNGGTSFIERDAIPRNDLWIDEWKVLLSGASGSGNDPQVLSLPIVTAPGSACTETYLVIGRFDTKAEADNLSRYLSSRFLRFLVSLRKYTQHIYSERFQFVPDLPMDQEWTDKALYKKFKLSIDEIAFIESMVRPMELNND